MLAFLEAVWFSPLLPAAIPLGRMWSRQLNFLRAAINTVNTGASQAKREILYMLFFL